MKTYQKVVFRLAAGLLPCCLFAFLVACSNHGESKTKGPDKSGKPPVPVLAAHAATRDVPVQLAAIGTVEPNVTVQVKAQVDGQLEQVAFQEGQDVKKGDLLFVIDKRSYEAALNQAKAELARVKAQANYSEATNRRFKELKSQSVVSQEEFEQASSNAAALRAQVDAAQAALEKARLELDYCTIRSPIDGRTGNLAVDAGNLVKENDDSLVSINQIQPITVSFTIPEKDMAEVKRRMAEGSMEVQAVVPQSGNKPTTGTVDFINNEVDRQTGTIRMKASFANKEKNLWPGQFVEVRLALSILKNAVVVPTEAIQTGQSGQYVYVLQPDDTALVRPVETGPAVDGHTAIAKGLHNDEQVVTDGQVRLTPGSKVVIKKDLEPEPQKGTGKGGSH